MGHGGALIPGSYKIAGSEAFSNCLAHQVSDKVIRVCVPMLYRALGRSRLLRQSATKQFHVNRMIIYDQTSAEYVFTLNSYIQPHPR